LRRRLEQKSWFCYVIGMNTKTKMIVGSLGVLFFFATGSVSANDIQKLQTAGNSFKSGVLSALPLNASLGLSWSDAYIGQLVSVQPHFGYGVSAGISTVSAGVFQDLLESFGANGGGGSTVMLPLVVAETRLGGFLLPFDIGFKFGSLNDLSSSLFLTPETKMDFTLIGGDLRASIFKGGFIMPAISIGLGYNHLTGTLSAPLNDIGADFNIGDNVLKATAPDVGLFWEMDAIDLKVQLSKRFLFITPYIIASGTFYWASAGYNLNGKLEYFNSDGITPRSWDSLDSDLAAQGINGIDINRNGLSSRSAAGTGISTRISGGLSLNLFLFRLDCALLYSFSDSNWGTNIGLRLQV
jgi:hypothetical protein